MLTNPQLQFRFAVGFAFNAGIFIFLPFRGSGEVEYDAPKYLIAGLLAMGAIVPSVALLRFGKGWHKAVAVLFLGLPGYLLFRTAEWTFRQW